MSEPAQVKHCLDCGVVLTEENWYTSLQRRWTYLCKGCVNKRTKIKSEKNIANGMCGDHKDRLIDPRSKTDCTECFEKGRLRKKRADEKVKRGGCREFGCLKPHANNSVKCVYHRDIARKRSNETNAIKYGIRWLKDAPPDMLLKFQQGRCDVCGMTKNGRELHRDHHHGKDNVGWLRGYLCSSDNTKLISAHVDESIEKALQYFRDHQMKEEQYKAFERYLTYTPYMRLLDSLGIEKPLGGETPAEYYERHPEQALSSKVNRNRKHDW